MAATVQLSLMYAGVDSARVPTLDPQYETTDGAVPSEDTVNSYITACTQK